jgi:hypothetical protein
LSLEAALEYRERGFSVLPLLPRGKSPHTVLLTAVHGDGGWKQFRSRRASVPELREWSAREPHFNIGVILGEASRGLVVIDVDGPTPTGLHHPATPISFTKRGYHAWMRSSSPVATERFGWGEIRGEGSYVAAPPSVHPDGPEYEWRVGLDDVDPADISELSYPRDGRSSDAASSPEIEVPQVPVSPSEDAVATDQLAADRDAVRRACNVLGIDAGLGKPFLCVLPGHEERKPSASIWRAEDGVYRYHDWHARSGIECLSLASVRASRAYGRVRRLNHPEVPRWYDRLFYDAGCLKPASVPMPSVPSGCRQSVRRVADSIELLLGLRWLRDPGGATPLSRRFLAAWCGCTERHAGEAIRELSNLRVIEVAGTYPCSTPAGPRDGNLYLPGPGPRRRSHGR